VGTGQTSALAAVQYAVEYLNGGNLEDSFTNAFNIMLIVFLVSLFDAYCDSADW